MTGKRSLWIRGRSPRYAWTHERRRGTGRPARTSDKGHWGTYTDPSGSIWFFLSLDKKSEDTNGCIDLDIDTL
ncbi:hypothetical protein [Streptomyces sp. NPDC088350]|uniref:hypothetical protein n=1 Tax=Streptomyces sp. NPDC088350 TaxID=3365854 RepID=UPI0037F95502